MTILIDTWLFIARLSQGGYCPWVGRSIVMSSNDQITTGLFPPLPRLRCFQIRPVFRSLFGESLALISGDTIAVQINRNQVSVRCLGQGYHLMQSKHSSPNFESLNFFWLQLLVIGFTGNRKFADFQKFLIMILYNQRSSIQG